jgi:succinyl-CoA synthetase alpha subunit
VDTETRLVVQGLTGSEGRFHGLRNRDYGTNVVAGVTPGKGGQDVAGIPIFDTVAEAAAATRANATLIFVPARFAADAVYEALDAGIVTLICITEHVPAHEMLGIHAYIRTKDVTMVGPNCPGVLSPGKANAGIIPAEIFAAGGIGLVSRSGTLTYQIGYELAQLGLGNSTIVGIGGDPVVGSSFADVLALFEGDPETERVVLVGEIGGEEEEKAAQYVADQMTKPVYAYIAGFSAPPGKTMGHAGAIVSGSSGTAQAKKEALEAAGIVVGVTPTEVARLVADDAGRAAVSRGRPGGGG